MMKKAGIVTLVGGANYGNVLQNYAVQQLLLEQGYAPYTLRNKTKLGFPCGASAWRVQPLWEKLNPSYLLDYRRTRLFEKYGCKNTRDCYGAGLQTAKANAAAFKKAAAQRQKKFDQCRAETLNTDPRPISRERHDSAQIAEYDAFIAGSDQIWNPGYWAMSSVDYLQFAPRHKRIALAASFGVSSIPPQRQDDIGAWLSSIDHLSVREEAGRKIVKELTGKDAKVLLDPTFALNPEQWSTYARQPETRPQGDYIFCYFLGNETGRYVRYIEGYAKAHQYEIVDICDIHDLRYYDIEPREFVWLLSHAKMVFTDSFHGTAFSIHMQVPFVVFPRVEGGASMSSRIATVLEKTGLTERKYPLTVEIDSQPDFAYAAKIIAGERTAIRNFLHEALLSVEKSSSPKLASRYHCTGCGACVNACKIGVLRLVQDKEGFAYPQLDEEKCIHCNACQRACPADTVVPGEENTRAYYAYAKDAEICRQSSSGGLFSLLAEAILTEGGVVYGAGFDENWVVCHQRIDRTEQIAKLRTSKYIQSAPRQTYREAEADLKDGKIVFFAGTPCQVAALRQYLGREYDNLYTQDIICHGVPSPGLWEQYKREQHPKDIRAISFRDKTCGWNAFSMKVDYADGSTYRKLATKDPYERAFLANLTLRPSCYQCQYKTVARVSDLTLADYWGVEEVHPELKEQQGVSLLLTHTEKGETLLHQLHDAAVICPTDLERSTTMNRGTTNSVRWHTHRNEFFAAAAKAPMAPLVKRYLRPTPKQRITRFVYRWGARGKGILRKIVNKRR